MIGTKILREEDFVIKVVTNEDGEKFIRIDDLAKFLKFFPQSENLALNQNQNSDYSMKKVIDYINNFILHYELVHIYRTSKYYGVRYFPKNTSRKDTLFYFFQEKNDSFITIPIKKGLLESDTIEFSYYTGFSKKSDSEYEKWIKEYDERGDSPDPSQKISFMYDSKVKTETYFIDPFYRDLFVEELYQFLADKIGINNLESWDNIHNIIELKKQPSKKNILISKSGCNSLFLPVLNKDICTQITNKTNRLKNQFQEGLSQYKSDYITIQEFEKRLEEDHYIENFNIDYYEEGMYCIPILAESNQKFLTENYNLFFQDCENKSYIYKTYVQKMYHDTVTLRPKNEKAFQTIIDYLFENSIDTYLENL